MRATVAVLLGLAAASSTSQQSGIKGGGLLIRPCALHLDGLFPASLPPEEWDGCGNDVYAYTWTRAAERGGLLASVGVTLGSQELLKLTRTMGFCPHQRCQLDDVVHSEGTAGVCPQGLCYTKIERGALSYGACCFTDNKFETSQLLGFYNKTQQTPKPIYKASRVVLGDVDHANNTYEAFINPNVVADDGGGLIATQCPLQSTVVDAKRLMVERNVTLWVHLSPFSPSGDEAAPLGRQCEVFPLAYFDPSSSRFSPALAAGVSRLSISRSNVEAHTNITYSLTARVRGAAVLGFDAGSSGGPEETRTHHCEHVWFHRWADFVTPEAAFEAPLRALVARAAQALRGGGAVVVSCVSGRGRSGTSAAMTLGTARGVRSVAELVDLIVDMRRRRDGLVETPRQFHLAASMLGLEVEAQDKDL